jgi:hypothetical protein
MNIFTGVYQLITSPSGIFSLLCLGVLSVLSWHLGIAWVTAAAAAWSAFFAVIPAALGYFEHKETMAQMQSPFPQGFPQPFPAPVVVVPSPLPPTGPTVPVPTPITTTNTTVTVATNLPDRGRL